MKAEGSSGPVLHDFLHEFVDLCSGLGQGGAALGREGVAFAMVAALDLCPASQIARRAESVQDRVEGPGAEGVAVPA